MFQIIFYAVLGEFPFDAVARPPHAGAFRVAALYHEASDDSMENKAVIKVFADQGDKVVDGIRRDFGV
jgi:hypothetical protein